jgi:tetratricopeptide (TPR) repeat protein
MSKICMTAAACALLFALCTARAKVTPGQKQSDDPVMDAAVMVQKAFDAINHNNVTSAQSELNIAIHAKGFAGLTDDVRYRALLVASLLAEQDGRHNKAHDLAVRATAFHEADDTAWTTRLSSAIATDDWNDAGRSVAMLARRWPGQLDKFLPGATLQLHYLLKQAHDADTDREMLDALFDAGWKARGVEPSALWRDLALMHLERHEMARAATVALRVTSGQVALSMLVDRRFDPITLKHPGAFHVDRLIAAEIKAAQARIKAHPDRLRPITDLQELFLITGQYPRVLSISDAAVANAEKGDGKKTYKDFGDRYNWVLDNRSRAYKREGHWDDAVQTEALAVRIPEMGGINVSQSINLGELYADLDQPDKASNAIAELGDLTPIGCMQLESVKLQIAIDRKDNKAIASAMAYLRKHHAEDMDTWEDTLLLRGKLDEAAALLIERLQNPAWRSEALVDMQRYVPVAETPVDKIIQDNLDTVTARPDVVAAMRKVGRVERFDITAGLR